MSCALPEDTALLVRNVNICIDWEWIFTYFLHSQKFKPYRTSMQHAENKLEEIMAQYRPLLRERITDEPNLSVMINSYIKEYPLMYQSKGQSSIVHQGTVFASMKNKVFSFPLGSIGSTPNNAMLHVVDKR